MRRYPASIISAPVVTPTTMNHAGMWTLPEVQQLKQAGNWWPDATISFTASTVSGSNSTGYTFSAQALGTTTAGRKIIVAAGCEQAGAPALNSVTVAGNAMAAQVDTGSGINMRGNILSLEYVTSASANIVVNFSSGALAAGIGVWAAYNLGSATAYHTATDNTFPQTQNLNFAAGGVGVGYMASDTNVSATGHTWTGMTENFDAAMEVTPSHTGASLASTAQQTVSVTCTPATANIDVMALASFR